MRYTNTSNHKPTDLENMLSTIFSNVSSIERLLSDKNVKVTNIEITFNVDTSPQPKEIVLGLDDDFWVGVALQKW